MKFLDDERLYTRTDYCLQFLRELDSPAPAAPSAEPEPVHFYWRGVFSRKQAFCLKSFLATQDPARFDLWLWLDLEDGYAGCERNPHLRPLLPYLQVRSFDPAVEAHATPLADHPELYQGLRPSLRGNYMRYAVLYKYGGLYCDLDFMFLRDLRPLLRWLQPAQQFCYQWSAESYANNGLLRLRAGGAAAHAIAARAVQLGTSLSKLALRFADFRGLDLLVLPSAFFDPLWLHRDRRDRYAAAPYSRFADFFRPFDWRFRRRPAITSYRDFFPGAFAYHWHNCWNAPEQPNSYFGLFEAEFDDLLRARFGIAAPGAPAEAEASPRPRLFGRRA